jgi:hypothetical protein
VTGREPSEADPTPTLTWAEAEAKVRAAITTAGFDPNVLAWSVSPRGVYYTGHVSARSGCTPLTLDEALAIGEAFEPPPRAFSRFGGSFCAYHDGVTLHIRHQGGAR